MPETTLKSSNSHPDLYVVDLPPADMSGLISDDMDIVTRISLLVEESVGPLRTVLSGLNVLKALIIDIFCTSMFDVGKDLSIPVYSFFTASTVLFMFSMYLPVLDQEVEGEFVDLPKVPGCNPILIQDLFSQVRNRKVNEYKWYLLHVRRLCMATGIFLNTWDDLEPVSLKALKHEPFFLNNSTPSVYPIGPLTKQIEPVETEYDKGIIAWLDKQLKDSVLFIALGSVYPIGPLTKQIEPVETEYDKGIIAWLDKQLKDSVLFIALGSGGKLTSEQLTDTEKESDDLKVYLPNGFVERTNWVGLVTASWVPQVSV
ncbi:UDP-glucuronosyl/UDP-glucosyltransferase [Artemisia annua]|uniref:UDP-glucuronosyl/UDP-glucosyltransferase n=1 Tax=Artemisia annua TaxID=35608 RepID=A0A2U1KQS3_ARTAN|nr:UDP-glucuronosyl/UDP-glucosyltransferase [Artemisia annua]